MTKKITVTILLLSLSLQTFAWGTTGHRVVGEIADSYLSRKTKRSIREILGNESVAMSSNWADFAKSDSTLKYLEPFKSDSMCIVPNKPEVGATKEPLTVP